jgi:hypothetical protein
VLVVAFGSLSPDLVDAVQAFRSAIYAADGVHVDRSIDTDCYHIVEIRSGGLAGCVRYQQRAGGRALIGAWAVAEDYRNTRVAVRLVLECFHLAGRLGDTTGIATATTRHGSAEILQRLGGRLLARYWDETYRCEMVRLEFTIDRKLKAA